MVVCSSFPTLFHTCNLPDELRLTFAEDIVTDANVHSYPSSEMNEL